MMASETIDELQRRSSLLTWWPAVRRSGVPAPRTIIVKAGWERLAGYLDGQDVGILRHVERAARALGWPERPVFLRTDQASAKHSYIQTCFLDRATRLPYNLYRLIDENFAYGLSPQAIVVRRWLPLYHEFTAWQGLPIAKERRYFVRDGQVICHHPYWPAEALERPMARPSVPDWRERLRRLNAESKGEVLELTGYAARVGQYLAGYWSIDFAQDADGQWWCIDMAAGELSWHPARCVHAVRAA